MGIKLQACDPLITGPLNYGSNELIPLVNIRQFVSTVLARVGRGTIRRLDVFGAGKPGAQGFGGGNPKVQADDPAFSLFCGRRGLSEAQSLQALAGRFDPDGIVILNGHAVCERDATGARPGGKLIQMLCLLWGVAVQASDAGDGNFVYRAVPPNGTWSRMPRGLPF